MSENILEINNLSKYFGGLAAVSECSLKVKKELSQVLLDQTVLVKLLYLILLLEI